MSEVENRSNSFIIQQRKPRMETNRAAVADRFCFQNGGKYCLLPETVTEFISLSSDDSSPETCSSPSNHHNFQSSGNSCSLFLSFHKTLASNLQISTTYVQCHTCRAWETDGSEFLKCIKQTHFMLNINANYFHLTMGSGFILKMIQT